MSAGSEVDEADDDPADTESLGVESSDVEASPYMQVDGVALADGLALTVDQASKLASKAGATLVMPLGPVKVGKTTLAVEIYSRFLRQTEWAGCSYCWSDTLLDYELLALPSRVGSGADLPTTWRTRLGETRHLLHLRLAHSENKKTDLLFANLSGEHSENIRDGHDPAEEIPLLERSERILICVDGERVADPALHGRATSDTEQMLGTLEEMGHFLPTARAAMVLTKWDKVVAAGREAQWAETEKVLVKQMERLGLGTTAFRVAARPEGVVPPDDETEGLLSWLVARPEVTPPQPPAPSSPSRALGRIEEELR